MQHTPDPALDHPRSRTAFRGVRRLVSGYLGLSVLTLVAIVLLRGDAAAVNDAVWIRGTLVVVSAVVMFVCAVRAARGSRPAYHRMRIISAAMVLVIAVIIVLPGPFPLWLKIEQGVCGLVLTGVVAILNGRHLRTLFADR
ncbi:hypothetical protein [Streptomyces gilvosporeus]|uniref:Uncharacterized protein n=1 Tax=Streptomyces gilvosporeus TaxID=553510 RepID=A0A1V0TVV9_9ACTN|nr:hypothetical protein [Streptomyces gilvosporeus]ARF56888.1 hypothetical protein B1H19_24375 [Streptomyces gilvosporeus]